jgi:hypothetical protein
VVEEAQSLMYDTYTLAKKKIVSHVLTPFRRYETRHYARRKGRPQRRSFLSRCTQ